MLFFYSDYPVDGTLNLCHETLIAHEKESALSDLPVPRKRPKCAKISAFLFDLNITDILARLGCFLGNERLDLTDSFS